MKGTQTLLKNDEARKIIDACCEASLPAIIIGLESGAVIHGHFAAPQKDGLVFHPDISPAQAGAADHISLFATAAACSVSFMAGSRGGVFLSVVKRIDKTDATGELLALVLGYPDEVLLAERRRSYRVDVAPDSGLAAVVRDASRVVAARSVNNISYDGVQLETPQGDGDFVPGRHVQVELQMDGRKVVVDGEVRRMVQTADGKSNVCVILFFKTFSGGMAEPPEDLRRLVKTLDLLAIRRTPR